MGKLEETSRKDARRTKIQEAIIASLAGKKLEASSLIPEALNYFLDLDLPTYSRKREAIASAAVRLRGLGLVTLVDGHYNLTKAGEELLNKWRVSNFQIKKPKKWDNKWRVIIFDIPEKKRRLRAEVRHILIETGFQRLQDSVWVYPYDCEEMIGLLKMDLGLGKYLLYMIVDQIENDRYLKMDFGLID